MNVDLDGMLRNARSALTSFSELVSDGDAPPVRCRNRDGDIDDEALEDLIMAEQPRLAAFMLGELGRHLRQLRDQWKAGDLGVVDEFFALYALDNPPRAPSAPLLHIKPVHLDTFWCGTDEGDCVFALSAGRVVLAVHPGLLVCPTCLAHALAPREGAPDVG